MAIATTNPTDGKVLKTYENIDNGEINKILENSKSAFDSWKLTSFGERKKIFMKVASLLREKRDYYAKLITIEMGCPISQANSEIEKCAFITEIFANDSEKMLSNENIDYDAKEVYISFEPLGPILHIAPWNYPFYLVLRPAIPAIMAGNTIVMKHASNVPQTSLAIQELFLEAGLPKGVFQSMLVSSSQINDIIEDSRIEMVTLIGSEPAGRAVASQASSHIKKTVMELGGSDPFIVFDDCDLQEAAKNAAYSRLRNAGQSCNAAKRFIVHSSIAKDFTEKLKQEFEKEVIGDPMDTKTTMGPVATKGQLIDVERQVNDSVSKGAQTVIGGKRVDGKDGYYFEPTILSNVSKGMPAYDEEVFGPVAPIISFDTIEEAIEIANDTRYGLGASIWTKDENMAKSMIPKIEAGNVYINSVVRGNPKLPFGGIKKSGYGREFGEYGIKEFVNIKSVVIK